MGSAAPGQCRRAFFPTTRARGRGWNPLEHLILSWVFLDSDAVSTQIRELSSVENLEDPEHCEMMMLC
jgi:hypothetical protein